MMSDIMLRAEIITSDMIPMTLDVFMNVEVLSAPDAADRASALHVAIAAPASV